MNSVSGAAISLILLAFAMHVYASSVATSSTGEGRKAGRVHLFMRRFISPAWQDKPDTKPFVERRPDGTWESGAR